MQLPVDFKQLLDETMNIEAAHSTEIAVSVYIDETAPADLAAHVRNAFASSLATVRMTITYLNPGFVPQPTDDIAVIVAGESNDIGEDAQKLRDVGVPVMVVSTDPKQVSARAEQAGYPIPAHDLVSPAEHSKAEPDPEQEAQSVIEAAAKKLPIANSPIGSLIGNSKVFGKSDAKSDQAKQQEKAAEAAAALQEAVADKDASEPSASGPMELTEARARDLDNRMGRWIVSVCREKRLAYAIAFPFVRRPLAYDSVKTTALQNAGIGLVPFIPGADLPIMTLNQAKMVLQIGAAYGQHMDKARWKEIAAVIGVAYVTRGIARRLVAAVPILGYPIKAGVAYGLTAGMGYGVIEYFEGGQNATGIANVLEHAVAKGTKVADKVRGVVGKYAPALQGSTEQ